MPDPVHQPNEEADEEGVESDFEEADSDLEAAPSPPWWAAEMCDLFPEDDASDEENKGKD